MKTNLLKSIFISLILLMGVSNAWGKTVNGPRIYFDNSSMNMTSTQVYFVVGHNSFSRTYGPMTEISDTKLLYRDISTETYYNWGDATYVGFIQVGSKWGDGSWGSSNLTNATNYTKANTSWNSFDWQNTYYCKATSKGGTLSIDYKSAGYNGIPKYDATQSAKVRNTKSGSYSTVTSGDWPATLKLTGTYLSGDGASGRSEISSTKSSDGNNKKVYGAVVTGLITHSYSDPNDDYQFDGWIKGEGASYTSTNATYSYNITAATTVYACFTKKYAVNFGVHSSGGGSISAKAGSATITSGNKVVGGTSISFTATPNAGYRVQGWYSNSACTTPIDNGTDNTYTVTITDGTNVYVQYEEIPEEKYTVTIQTNNANYGTVSPSGPQQVGKSGINITATAKTGYQFDEWTCTSYASVEDASNPNTIASATAAGTVTANFSIKNYTITYNLNGGTNNTSNPESYTVETETITLQDPTKEGFLFAGWYTSSTFSETAVTSINKGSTGNKTYYAKWIDSRDCIFFYNNLGWSNVYVYFYNDAAGNNYWADGYGTGANKQQQFWDNKPYWEMEHGTMTQIKGTNIWYYYATYIKTNKRSKVSFANVNQSCDKEANNTNSYFQNAKVVYRADLDYEKRLPMFVPHTTQSHYFSNTKSTYYNHGYWMNYPTNTGYTLKIYNHTGDDATEWRSIPFEYSEDMVMPLTLSVSGMEGGKTYGFKILRADNKWYGNNGTMTTGHSGDTGQTAWEFTTDTKNCGLTTTAAGTYVFTLKYGKDANKNYNYLVGVEYPASVGDYRLVYQDDTHPFHPGHLLKKRAGSDIVSFFVHYNENPVIMLQQVTKINANTGAITWETISTKSNFNGITATGIYNFVLEQTDSEATLQNSATKYTGNFYIRTDAAAGGWGNFRQNSNKMTYTSYAENQGFGFNHYFVEWINAGTNVKFTIANDYSYCLSDSLNADDIVTTGNLPANANVRFGWDSKTNELSRAYIAGSSNASDRFLVLTGNENLLDIAGKPIPVGTGDRAGLKEHELIFSDKQNWIYQLDVQANSNTEITLTAKYNNKVQTFFGTSKSGFGGEPIMQATNDDYHKVRMIYDFKTNNLIAAWLLDETQYPNTTSVASNMLIIREDQGNANQINFSNIDNDNMTIQTAYAVMTFTKTHIDDKDLSERERSEYWVSFPFDVKISDVFGFSEYGDKWIMQLYDGAERAEKGYWIDSPTFWKYITNRNYTLKAGVGYVLKLNLNKMDFPNNSTDASLFFPSQGIPTVINAEPTPITVPAHECTIERDNRNIHDSHWNLIGVPGYANLENLKVDKLNQTVTIENKAQNLAFYYEYDAAKNSYNTSLATATFKNMHAYMVQYAGELAWTNIQETPAQLAARRNSDAEPEKRTLRLEIAQGEEMADQTFVQLQQEGATPEFDMNLDLTKIINSGANIYTLAGEQRIQSAGNAIPMEEAIVPVGVKVDTDGEYTFRMPDGTEGMVVELIDYELETTTNLLLFDYTVTLPKGTNEGRFALHIQPSKSGVTTGIEGAYPQPLPEGKGTKFLINGKLIIRTAEGVVYDAQGHRL